MTDAAGDTALLAAARAGHAEVVLQILQRGANPAVANSLGDTALHWACYRGDVGVAAKLLEKGAPVEAVGT